ncbi:MAG: ribonuclease H-like domain-containing protein [Methanobrevibacter sp.]|uniref:ribonuclease H-like domain-containing protein n=1 Tax=Methanobrevibacter sp. TaxID=66852 RepID=UPI001B707256|nr:ribonuclease H-like domain-containing protein [Methanobrevibacter sp.]MBP3790918.1 ribonuclease H-like domain-containing protein [Methanobrevibacter sp.]
MTDDNNFEEYLRKVLSNSISSQNPSEEAKDKARKLSPSYFSDLKEKLLIEYEGKKLKDVMDCKICSNSFGDVLKITTEEKINFNIEDNDFKNQINYNLKLLPRIGLKTEQNLKDKGYDTIESLTEHDKYSNLASDFLSKIDDMSYLEIIDLLDNNKYSKKCRDNILKSISLKDPENFKFMDIETKGLSNVPIILIGVAEIKGNKIVSSQYFLRDYAEEGNIIEAYLSHLDEDSVHVTFNGKTFDVPFIKNRCSYNRINANLDLPHLDLMYFAKNLWGDQLPNCQLQTIERELFGIEREGDVPGQYIPGYYDTYLEKDNIGPVVPIIEHNCQDIISLASFLEKMYRDVN